MGPSEASDVQGPPVKLNLGEAGRAGIPPDKMSKIIDYAIVTGYRAAQIKARRDQIKAVHTFQGTPANMAFLEKQLREDHCAGSTRSIEDAVKALLLEGWTLQGHATESGLIYSQTMVKYEPVAHNLLD